VSCTFVIKRRHRADYGRHSSAGVGRRGFLTSLFSKYQTIKNSCIYLAFGEIGEKQQLSIGPLFLEEILDQLS
jgi:hypothetical protein